MLEYKAMEVDMKVSDDVINKLVQKGWKVHTAAFHSPQGYMTACKIYLLLEREADASTEKLEEKPEASKTEEAPPTVTMAPDSKD